MIEITDKSRCSGCTTCSAICPKSCISMKEDNEGFLYPIVDREVCINCGACDKVCPILNKKQEVPFEQKGYVVQNKNRKILRESTSGGAFTAMAKYMLNQGGVVFGVEFTEKFSAHHVYVENEKDLGRFRNSKYVQSCVGEDTFRQVKRFLNEDRYVCFSGTPCQIEGLKNFLKKDYGKLITVDVVCRAVPSPLILRKYIHFMQNKMQDKVENIRFRDKHYGYKYSTMNLVTKKNNGDYHRGVESDPWLRAFFSGICNRPSCYDCKFKKRYRVSDFTIWDCFAVGRFSKEMDNDLGATKVLVHTEKGRAVFESILSDFHYIEVEPDKLIEGVAEMVKSVSKNEKRGEFFDDASKLSDVELFAKYFPNNLRSNSERIIRMMCYKLGIYSLAKKVYVKVTGKY